MKHLLLLCTLCLALNITAQNNPTGATPLHQQLSDLKKTGILSIDDLDLVADQSKPTGRLSALLTPQRKSPTDVIQLEDSIYTWNWDATLGDWIYYTKTTDITYDADNNIIGYIDSEWDGFEWVAPYQYAYTYDDNHNPTSYTRRSWDGLSWQNEVQVTYTYDANNNLLSYLSQGWNGTEWIASVRYTYTYNANNDVTSALIEQWENDAWENIARGISTFDPNFNRTHYLFQLWENDAWVNNQQVTTSYDANNLPDVSLQQVWDGNAWVNSQQSTFGYDAANNLTSEMVLTWDGVAWLNGSFFTYTYDANNNLISELYQSGENGEWINNEFITSTYDAGNKISSGLLHFWNGVGWEPTEQYLYTYDSHDNLIGYDVQELLGEWIYVFRNSFYYDENDFLVYEVYKNYELSDVVVYGDSTHYYFRTITAIGDVLPDSDRVTISPNPANGHFTVTSENEINAIRVFNLLGENIYTSEKNTGLTTKEIEIAAWPAGLYLVRIKQGEQFYTKKLIVQ